MSRSRKKTPIIKFGGCPDGKRMANRKVRRLSILPAGKGNSYKKFYPQYDVNDFVVYQANGTAGGDDGTDDWWERVFYRK